MVKALVEVEDFFFLFFLFLFFFLAILWLVGGCLSVGKDCSRNVLGRVEKVKGNVVDL